MTLEETIEHPANTKKMAINRVGDNSILVEKVSDTKYACGIETSSLNPSHYLATYSSLQDVENHLIEAWS